MFLVHAFASAQSLPLPARATNALDGTDIIQRLAPLDLPQREQEIISQIISGNVPNFLRRLCPIHVSNIVNGWTNEATFYVAPDYLTIGSDDDYFLAPMSPNTAQRIAEGVGCCLPTRKMVDDIYAAAEVKPIDNPGASAATMLPAHAAALKTQRKPRRR